MDLGPNVFKKPSARAIAHSLKHSAESSNRRKSPPFQSAMSMLNFYIARDGTNLSAKQKQVLVRAKGELRKLFHRSGAEVTAVQTLREVHRWLLRTRVSEGLVRWIIRIRRHNRI